MPAALAIHQVNVVEADACSHDTHYASAAQCSKRSRIKKHLVPGDQDRSRSFSDNTHKIGRHEADALFKAIQITKISNPATDCVSPIGEPLLLAGYQGMKQRAAKLPDVGKARLTEAVERLVQIYDSTSQKDKEITPPKLPNTQTQTLPPFSLQSLRRLLNPPYLPFLNIEP